MWSEISQNKLEDLNIVTAAGVICVCLKNWKQLFNICMFYELEVFFSINNFFALQFYEMISWCLQEVDFIGHWNIGCVNWFNSVVLCPVVANLTVTNTCIITEFSVCVYCMWSRFVEIILKQAYMVPPVNLTIKLHFSCFSRWFILPVLDFWNDGS